MKQNIYKRLLCILIAGILFFSGGCGFLDRVAAAIAGKASADKETTVDAPERDTGKRYYKNKEHSSVPVNERSRRSFDEEVFDRHCREFEESQKKGETAKHFLACYRELLHDIDLLVSDYWLNDFDYSKDVTDRDAADAVAELEQLYSESVDRVYLLLQKALHGRFKATLRLEIGSEWADVIEDYEALTEEELALKEQITRLEQEYNEQILSLNQSFSEKKLQRIKEIYLELVRLNNETAVLHGYDNYADYANEVIYARDYTAEDTKEIEDVILNEFLPLYSSYENMIANDNAIFRCYQRNTESAKSIWEKLRPVIEEVFPELLEAFLHLTDIGTYDMDPGKDKLHGGYTVGLPAYGDALIFYNPDESYTDYLTYIHEFGHYNQMYHSIQPELYALNILDVAEIHSQGLELLFYDYYPVLNRSAGKGLQQNMIYNIFTGVLSGMAANEAECRIYQEKNLTIEKIDEIWDDVAEKYGMEGYMDASSWYEIGHVFVAPMYYISYATSALASLEVFLLAQDDWEAGTDSYLQLTALPAETMFCEALEAVGLPDVFDPDTIHEMIRDLTVLLSLSDTAAQAA